ncbi:hypothetical protein BN8_01278 [Fibrisoma limi BUZ 3]|uniref:Outer membrane protein beta-barrel domain-containing protein n=1 Tax=Fibrisoma limi BUZ 3 TaxID=1185876 RepID=I2GEG5_9BACT|nr:outer membrane beta-barrel protein [Fibrisoma limi]CCH52290.1 hypothetical protein BN8_01278 [Fibrisoma limi BUZ 3]
MKNHVTAALLAVGVFGTGLVFGQRNSYNERYDRSRDYDDRSYRRDDARRDDYRMSDRRDDARRYRDDRRMFDDRDRYQMDERLRERQDDRRNQSVDDILDERRDYVRRREQNDNYDNRYREERMDQRRFDRFDLGKAYDEGYDDGRSDAEQTRKKQKREDYKNFTVGVYAGANSTRFEGEDVEGNQLSGRLGYQLGLFVRGGGRLYGQIGAEYLTSSNDFYQPGDGTSPEGIINNIDQKYLHIPAYIGFKLAESDRGISAVRLQVGAEYATPLGVNNNEFNFERSDFNNATINGLASIGFDAGPLMVGFVYHYGFADVLKNTENSKRRILGVNVGFKF